MIEEHTEWFVGLMERIMPKYDPSCTGLLTQEDVFAIMREVYWDSMRHGYKHGFEDANEGVWPFKDDVCPECGIMSPQYACGRYKCDHCGTIFGEGI